ncbi:MAG: hypothetical protein ACFFCM_18460 [Promethearchaeota archaeon]
MIIDLDELIDKGADVENEMHKTFKDLESEFEEIVDIHGKYEKHYKKIAKKLKDYAQKTSEVETESPVFGLSQKYESLIEGQKSLITNLTNDVVLVLKQIVEKSEILNDSIKELNSFAKDTKKLRDKIKDLKEDIEKMKEKGKTEKIPKKEAELTGKESQYKVVEDKLKGAKNRFDEMWAEFNSEYSPMFKGALAKMSAANKTYIALLTEVADEEASTSENL